MSPKRLRQNCCWNRVTGSHHSCFQKHALASDQPTIHLVTYGPLTNVFTLLYRLRIQYKLCVCMHMVRIGRSPAYLAEMMTATADQPGRERLRFAKSFRNENPKLKFKLGERGFSYAGPRCGTHFLPISRN